MILAGEVLVNEVPVSKSGTQVSVDAAIRLRRDPNPFVSRGGLKLQAALERFRPSLEGRIAMDVGASTGGFTDCLLQGGVSKVYAVDVGYGQLAWKIAQDPRVVVLDRQNIRTMDPALVPDPIEVLVAERLAVRPLWFHVETR